MHFVDGTRARETENIIVQAYDYELLLVEEPGACGVCVYNQRKIN